MDHLCGAYTAAHDEAGVEAVTKRCCDESTVPQPLSRKRDLRFPKQSFVYAADLRVVPLSRRQGRGVPADPAEA